MAFNAALRKAIGRDQGPQLWFSQSFTPGTANVQVTQPSFADLSRPSEGVEIILRYRASIGTAAYTSLNAEAPQNLLQFVKLYGNSTRAGNVNLWNASGATLFGIDSAADTTGVGGKQYITSSVAAQQFRMPRLSSPMGLAIGTANGQFGGVASYDVETHYYIPFGPFGGNDVQATLFSQRDADWNRTMAITLTLGTNPTTGAADAFGVKASTTTLAFTGYGGVGNPTVSVYLIPTLQQSATGAIVSAYTPGVIVRSVNAPATSLVTSNPNALLMLLQNYDTPNIWTKAGVVTSLGDFSSLSDAILTQTYLTVGGKPVVQLNDEFSQKDWYESKIEGLLPQGYNVISFVGGGTRMHWPRIFKAPVPGTQWNLSANVAGAANQSGEILQEQVFVQPALVGAAA